jgi:hypothetical protein
VKESGGQLGDFEIQRGGGPAREAKASSAAYRGSTVEVIGPENVWEVAGLTGEGLQRDDHIKPQRPESHGSLQSPDLIRTARSSPSPSRLNLPDNRRCSVARNPLKRMKHLARKG